MQTMFDLEKALTTWRRFLASGRGLDADDLDELEAHLRDEIDALLADGLPPERAFRRALGQMGDYATIEAAYETLHWRKLRHEHKLKDELLNRGAMLKNFLVVTLRSLRRDKVYTTLNLLGLVIGLASFLLLARFLHHELSYDRFHEEADQVYRLTSAYNWKGSETRFALVPGYTDLLLERDVPDVEAAATLFSLQGDMVLRRGERTFTETRAFYTTADFPRVFTFPLLQGDPATMLAAPNSIVLTAPTAHRYFGAADPMGQTVEWIETDTSRTLTVTGVLAPLPQNSHLQFDFLLSGNTMGGYWEDFFFAPDANPMVYVYFRTREALPLPALATKVDAAVAAWQRQVNSEAVAAGDFNMRTPVQPLTEVYFNATNQFEPTAGGNLTYVWILGVVALFMLFVAGINYVNLTTARSLRRAREVGVRKVLGSTRKELVGQFLLEAILMGGVASVFAVGLADVVVQGLVRPWTGAHLSLFAAPLFLALGVLTGLGVGLLAGLVPAFGMTHFPLVATLKGSLSLKADTVFSLRGVLVMLQFAVTICLLTGALVILKQVNYLKQRGLGYDTEHLVTLRHYRDESPANWTAFRESLRSLPGVQQVGGMQYELIGDYNTTASFPFLAGERQAAVRVKYNLVDPSFLDATQMPLVQGQGFSPEGSTGQGLIVNETALRAMGTDNLEDLELSAYFTNGERLPVIGVVQDFHLQSFNNEISPVVFVLSDDPLSLVVRLGGGGVGQTLDSMAGLWRQHGLLGPFAYTFLDDSFAQLIRKEQVLSYIVLAFTLVSILIACLGLIGLLGYVTERKRKEIGIRKVLGASRVSLVALINRRFSLALVGAFVLSIPLAGWGTQHWLANFVYRIDLQPLDFLVTGVLVFVLVVLTVSVQSFRAASADPVESLRYE